MKLFDMLLAKKLGGSSGGGGYPEPTGTINITQNGTYNVKDYASADVNVSGGSQIVHLFNAPYFQNTDIGGSTQVPFQIAMASYYGSKVVVYDNVVNLQLFPKSEENTDTNRNFWNAIISAEVEAIAIKKFKPSGPSSTPTSNQIYIDENGSIPLDIVLYDPLASVVPMNLGRKVTLQSVIMQNIYVPDDLVNDYKEATNWSYFANNIKPLSTWKYYEEI